MRILYVDHALHQKTKSTAFFHKLLLDRGEVDCFWDAKTWCGDGKSDFSEELLDQYDLIVFFQSEGVLNHILKFGRSKLPHMTFIPMYDSAASMPDSFWQSLPGNVRILNFSSTLHHHVVALGCHSFYSKYFIDPDCYPQCPYDTLSATFWWRLQRPNFRTVRKLTGRGKGFSKIHVHLAPDPGVSARLLDRFLMKCPIEITYWSKEANSYLEHLSHSNVYFAPRMTEGIGMSFLEAMARGQAVAAVNAPTMCEYIEHGVNGWLYDPSNPSAIDFSDFRTIGEAARESIRSGFERWTNQIPRMLDWTCHH